jgi:hypothetical protein
MGSECLLGVLDGLSWLFVLLMGMVVVVWMCFHNYVVGKASVFFF